MNLARRATFRAQAGSAGGDFAVYLLGLITTALATRLTFLADGRRC
jgi:hypothetical protein